MKKHIEKKITISNRVRTENYFVKKMFKYKISTKQKIPKKFFTAKKFRKKIE